MFHVDLLRPRRETLSMLFVINLISGEIQLKEVLQDINFFAPSMSLRPRLKIFAPKDTYFVVANCVIRVNNNLNVFDISKNNVSNVILIIDCRK